MFTSEVWISSAVDHNEKVMLFLMLSVITPTGLQRIVFKLKTWTGFSQWHVHLKLHYLSWCLKGSLICSCSRLTLTWSLWSLAGISRAHHLSCGILLTLHRISSPPVLLNTLLCLFSAILRCRGKTQKDVALHKLCSRPLISSSDRWRKRLLTFYVFSYCQTKPIRPVLSVYLKPDISWKKTQLKIL